MNTDTTIGRLLSRSTIDHKRGCWLRGGALRHGYSPISVDGQQTYAHRVAYECFKGPIPDGLQIDHLCRVTNCCNPDHLEAVTQRENVMRSLGPSAFAVRKTHCLRGHSLEGATVWHYKGKRKCRPCSRLRLNAWRAKQRESGHQVS